MPSKNLWEISSLWLARVSRFATNNIDIYGMPRVEFKIIWMAPECCCDRRLPPFVALKSVPSRDTSSRGDGRRPHHGGLLTRSRCSPVRRAMGRHGRFDSKIFESAHHFRIESNRAADSNSNRISKLRKSLL